MFSSTVLDVAIGLMFVFFVVSLAASAILEAIAGIITWRSSSLLKNIKGLLNDKNFTGLASQLYQHALISPRNDGPALANALAVSPGVDGKALEKVLKKQAPSYIDPKQFADALLDILSTSSAATGSPHPAVTSPPFVGVLVSGDIDAIALAIDQLVPPSTNQQMNDLLKGMLRRSGGDLVKMRGELSTWFDNAMDRVSGVYKRWTQLWHFLIALGLAILLNLDAVHLAGSLWTQPGLAATIANNAKLGNETPTEAIKELQGLPLPIGWFNHSPPQASTKQAPGASNPPDAADQRTAGDISLYVASVVLGWLITALAALFGAPFWFDLLQKVIRLKGSGPSPKEKEDRTAAAQ